MRDLLTRNLAALERKNVKLANKIAQQDVTDNKVIPVAVKDSKLYTLKVQKNDGSFLLLHSIYNPVWQAEKAVSRLKFDIVGLYGVLGFGAGYYVRQILKKMNPRSLIIVIENRLDILRRAMELMDLTDIFGHPSFNLVDGTGNDVSASLARIATAFPVAAKLTDDLQFFVTPGMKEIEREEYNRLTKLFFDTLRFTSLTIGNSPEDTLVGLKQTLDNLDHLVKTPDLTKIRDEYKGKPAICVAAGPSLNKNIGELKKLQGKALIIAADTIVERLLQEKIIPDIVGVLERGEIVYNSFFKNKKLDTRMTLMGQSVIYPRIFAEFPGKKLAVLKKGIKIDEWVSGLVPEVLCIQSGNSVANMNFSIARALNCDPIILVGQDLAYGEDGATHATGTIYDGKKAADDNLSAGAEEYILGKNGKPLRTRKWWKVFHHWFEMEIAKTTARVIDATEGGALIHGTEIMTLREAGNQYCQREMTASFSELLPEVGNAEMMDRIKRLSEGIKAEIARLENTEQIIDDALGVLDDMRSYFMKNKVLDNNIADFVRQVNEAVGKILVHNKIFLFITQSLLVGDGRKDSKLGSIDTVNDCEKWLKNKITLFIELKGINRITRDVFSGGLEKIRDLGQGYDHDFTIG